MHVVCLWRHLIELMCEFRPLKGGMIATEAMRALGPDQEGTGSAAVPRAFVPSRLPSLPTPGRNVALSPIGAGGKGKESISGRPTIKKSPHASSDEEGGVVTSPPFSPTRPLPVIGRGGQGPLAIKSPLPPIGRGSKLPSLRRPTLDVTNTMASRQTSHDPFSSNTPVSVPPIRVPAGRAVPDNTQPKDSPKTTKPEEDKDKKT